jgi:hypothetical protein
VKAVKTLIFRTCIALLATGIFLPSSSHAQCSGVLKSISYNVITPGTGNDAHSFNVPQFDASKGTLVAVKISSVLSLQYAFQLENNNHSATNYIVSVGRNDFISTTALSSPISNMGHILQNYGPYSLAASDGVAGSGPDHISVAPFSVLNNFSDVSDSVTNGIANFIGTGNVEFDYFTTTYYNVPGNYTFTSVATDTINFTVSYYYCSIPALTSSLINFDAQLQKSNKIDLSWKTANEQANRTYNVQKSGDGINFDGVTDVRSNQDTVADYFYDYSLNNNDKNKVYFRLKIVDENNNSSYSDIRAVNLAEVQNEISLYPNPSNSFINVVFNHTLNNLQIDILSPGGESLQKYNFTNTNSAHINFINWLPPGVYFLHAYDADQKKNYVLSFMTQ